MAKRVPWFFTLPCITIIGAACGSEYLSLGYDLPDECPGQCVPLPPLGYDGPALLWFGPAADVPECPARAPALVFQGFDGLQNNPLECPTCDCSQPTCQFPVVTASNLSVCPNDVPGSTLTPFPAPESWNGVCISPGTLDPNLVESITVGPTTERPCEPVANLPQKGNPGPGFDVAARACAGEAIPETCQDPGHTCLPTAEPPPPGFRQCIMRIVPGDAEGLECPSDFPEEYAFYAAIDDQRECTPCTCTQTAASACAARVSAYSDTACTSALFENVAIGMATSQCVDVMSGFQLGSMEATWTVNQPGACEASGGEAIGEASLAELHVFCCQPPP